MPLGRSVITKLQLQFGQKKRDSGNARIGRDQRGSQTAAAPDQGLEQLIIDRSWQHLQHLQWRFSWTQHSFQVGLWRCAKLPGKDYDVWFVSLSVVVSGLWCHQPTLGSHVAVFAQSCSTLEA
ncbi:unnamed protein product [Durusdinium trenchii]|uniref:Uncharacterized protein n=1 Tax=Durusdinium trenchii TaxID=1381693 RepID=A0ABP0KA50_9DINO